MAVMITKANGQRVPFSEEKLRKSILRAGGGNEDVEMVLRTIRPTIHEGATTQEIYAAVARILEEHNKPAACRYNLRDALMKLGPAGFYFEKYIAALLATQGYHAELPEELQGACVFHEIDVALTRNKKQYAIECKFRNNFGDHVHLKDVMAAYARHLDLLDGAALGLCPRFDEFWVVTNGVFSDRARKYGTCKGLRLIGWKYPEGRGLVSMIDQTRLYPITVLCGLTHYEFSALAHADIMLCQDMTRHESAELAHKTGLPQSRIEELVELAAAVLSHKQNIPA